MIIPSALRSQTGAARQDAAATAAWPLIGGDLGNTRYTTLSQINTDNVKSLGGAWVSSPFVEGATSRAVPVVADGVMYINAGTRVHALNAATGETLWSWASNSANVEPAREGINSYTSLTGLPNAQGVGLGEALVFVGLTNGNVVALDQKAGKQVWITQVGFDPPKRGQRVSGAPTYAQGKVFVGLANGDFGLRGRVIALDAKTGKQLWQFFTVPGPGEPGHETWAQNNDVWKIGGAGVWHTGVVDGELGMVYFQTGNAQPFFGGELRPGNNLYTASVIALDMNTGKLRWYYQVVHHELWDADVAVPLVLYDAQVGGRTRKGLAAMRADGFLFLLDRETGKPLHPVEERPVPQNAAVRTAPTQPFPVGADSMLPDCSTWKEKIPAGFQLGCTYTAPAADKPNVLIPGFPGGVRVAPMSYNPQTGFFYAQGNSAIGWPRRMGPDPWYNSWGTPPAFLGLRTTGILAAIDSRTNKVVWKKEWPSAVSRSGSLTSAGGLLFQSAPDGNFEAYNSKTGDLLWRFHTGRGGQAGPASAYAINGEQYVAVATGPVIRAFKIGGTVPPEPPTAPVAEGPPLGRLEDATEIEVSSLALVGVPTAGRRWATDEHRFNPIRARVKVGTRVTWINNGTMVHTIAAVDGAWSTDRLEPAHEGYVTFERAGTYLYICKDHPWSYGQLVVVP